MPSIDSFKTRLPNFSSGRNFCNLEENSYHQIYKAPLEMFLYFHFKSTCNCGSGIGEVFLEILDFVLHVFHCVSLLEKCHIQE